MHSCHTIEIKFSRELNLCCACDEMAIHLVPLSLSGHHAPKHLLRCENPRTDYLTCPETGRHSIIIPLDSPQGKLQASQFLLMMTDHEDSRDIN